jgi:hypothetical protein
LKMGFQIFSITRTARFFLTPPANPLSANIF